MDSFPVEIGKCGVNCALTSCYRTGRCKGCGSEDTNQKRISKWKCKIRSCVSEKNLHHCGECQEFPCKIRSCVSEKNLHHCGECQEFPCKIRSSLDSRYLKTYSIDLARNIRLLRNLGPEGWLEEQKRDHTCRVCGDMVNPYSRECYGCGEKPSPD